MTQREDAANSISILLKDETIPTEVKDSITSKVRELTATQRSFDPADPAVKLLWDTIRDSRKVLSERQQAAEDLAAIVVA